MNRHRLESVIEPLAKWSLDFGSSEHHDTDSVAMIGSTEITVGTLRGAFERYFGMPFDYYQDRLKAAQRSAEVARDELNVVLGSLTCAA